MRWYVLLMLVGASSADAQSSATGVRREVARKYCDALFSGDVSTALELSFEPTVDQRRSIELLAVQGRSRRRVVEVLKLHDQQLKEFYPREECEQFSRSPETRKTVDRYVLSAPFEVELRRKGTRWFVVQPATTETPHCWHAAVLAVYEKAVTAAIAAAQGGAAAEKVMNGYASAVENALDQPMDCERGSP
ncbi:hypothetical protein [Myxococcus hansupus]|uniref:hypothetical protein n=1 Tax=Pseudomyxococcus hansupus TaxID=1297742 RepID=UPI0005D10433|nr:hypothetical protein [Myxococcus hansupus]